MARRERKNPNPVRKERTVVERGYFHTGNSGISISMIEKVQNYDWDERDRNNYEHILEIHHSAYGAGSTFQTPIAGPVMCDYYIEAFERLKQRMLNTVDYKVGHPFDRYNHRNEHNDAVKVVDIANGLKRDEVYGPEMVTGPNSTSTHLIGFVYRDKDGNPVRAEAVTGNHGHGSGSCGGGAPTYSPEEIGRPVMPKFEHHKRPITKVQERFQAESQAVRNDVVFHDNDGFPDEEQLACVLARDFLEVGFMNAPIQQVEVDGKRQVVEGFTVKVPAEVDEYIDAESLAQKLTDCLIDGRKVVPAETRIYIYIIMDAVQPEGPGMNPATFEKEGWRPASRQLMIRLGMLKP